MVRVMIQDQPYKYLRMVNSIKLKRSQYKNDAIQLKDFLILKLPPFSVTYTVKEKKRQFQI